MSATVVLTGVLAFSFLCACLGSLLSWANNLLPDSSEQLHEQINALLPQTQCGQCGYAGCRPYAAAIQSGTAINLCPPGGENTVVELANLLGQSIPDTRHLDSKIVTAALIREAECIGCTLCIQACPVDAIAGAPQLMHTVITSECTGCDLCVEPCPVDCIDMVAV